MKLLLNKEESAKVMKGLIKQQQGLRLIEIKERTIKEKEKEERIPCSDGLREGHYGIL